MDREGCNMWEVPAIPENGSLAYTRDWGLWFGKTGVTSSDNLSRVCLMEPGKNTLPTATRTQVSGRKAITGTSRFDAEGVIIEKLAAGEVVQEIDYGEIRFRKWEKDHWVWLEQGNPEEHGRYQGQVNGLLPHGKGSYLSPLGVKYDGLWEEGLEHGTGILTHPNGMRSEGEFREGKPWNTMAYDSNRKLLFWVQQGAIIRKNDD